jgi:hypothetical protein
MHGIDVPECRGPWAISIFEGHWKRLGSSWIHTDGDWRIDIESVLDLLADLQSSHCSHAQL